MEINCGFILRKITEFVFFKRLFHFCLGERGVIFFLLSGFGLFITYVKCALQINYKIYLSRKKKIKLPLFSSLSLMSTFWELSYQLLNTNITF